MLLDYTCRARWPEGLLCLNNTTDQQNSGWFTPPFESISAKHKGGGEPSDLVRFGDPFLAVSPLEIAILEAQNPNFFAPAAGQILARSLRQEGGVNLKGG